MGGRLWGLCLAVKQGGQVPDRDSDAPRNPRQLCPEGRNLLPAFGVDVDVLVLAPPGDHPHPTQVFVADHHHDAQGRQAVLWALICLNLKSPLYTRVCTGRPRSQYLLCCCLQHYVRKREMRAAAILGEDLAGWQPGEGRGTRPNDKEVKTVVVAPYWCSKARGSFWSLRGVMLWNL